MRRVSMPILVLVLAMAPIACSTGPTEEEQAAAAQDAEWTWLDETKAELDAKRGELRALREQIEARAEAAADEAAEEGEETAEELQAKAASLENELVATSDEFMGRLVGFINDQGIAVGGELTDVQRSAIRMKSAEEIVVAREYIEKGGDYSKAIEIYNQALTFDPDNEDLLAAKAEAEELQYMREDRFDQVKKGMSQAEVRALLGQVNLHNIKEYEERGTVAWFYRKEDNGAAGVFFKEKKKGEGDWRVYATDFDAVDPPSASG